MSFNGAKERMEQGKTIITAHSGCENTPDNSLEHIHAAIASGAEMLEVDLRMRPDGTLYLSHDVPETIEERPLLTDLLALIAGTANMGINLDAKEEGLIAPAMELVRQYGLTDRVVFTGACGNDRALAVSLGTDVWCNLAEEGETVKEGLEKILRNGSPCLNACYRQITSEDHRLMQSHGRGVSAWTINDEENLRRFLHMGVMNITTRIPVLAVELRKEIQGV